MCAVTVKVKELILVAVEAMHCLSEGNETTQSAMISAGHFDPIIKVLTQTRYLSVQVYYSLLRHKAATS